MKSVPTLHCTSSPYPCTLHSQNTEQRVFMHPSAILVFSSSRIFDLRLATRHFAFAWAHTCDTLRQSSSSCMASNGFAPPPPPRAEAVNTAAPTASPSSAVIAFHTRLIAALLASLPSLASQAPTSEWGTLAEALRAVDSWASLRDELNARLGEAGSALVKLDANAARQSARSVQRALERIGPAALAKECTSLDVAALAEPNKPESGLRQEDGVRWQGICELMTWLHTLRAVLTRPTTTECVDFSPWSIPSRSILTSIGFAEEPRRCPPSMRLLQCALRGTLRTVPRRSPRPSPHLRRRRHRLPAWALRPRRLSRSTSSSPKRRLSRTASMQSASLPSELLAQTWRED